MKLETYNDIENIEYYIPYIKEILDNAYKDKGGWFASSSIKTLIKKIKEIKLVIENNEILAVAVFEDRLGGLKCTGAAGNMLLDKSMYKPAFEYLMKTIIGLNNNTYWIEASDALEHYCKKYGGNPIPAAFVQNEMGFPVSAVDYDTYHYDRYIGLGKNLCTKCMYGFRDEETRNKVCDYLSAVSGIDYDQFKYTVNESIRDIRPIVYKIYELFDEFEITELTRPMKKVLLEGMKHTDRNIQKVSGFLLRNMELIKTLN